MKIVVCVKQSAGGEINPLDACAYEAALCIPGGEVTLLSMGPAKSEAMLSELSRLGARRSILISDSKFIGSDTLATAYVLSLAIKKLSPDLILCGNKTIDGETGQVGVELAQMLSMPVLNRVMRFSNQEGQLFAHLRNGQQVCVAYPAVATVERIGNLRFPSMFSRIGEVERWDAEFLDADPMQCGLNGSATRVLKSEENIRDRRNCVKIAPQELMRVIEESLDSSESETETNASETKIRGVWAVGAAAAAEARSVCEDLRVIEIDEAEKIARMIEEEKPVAVLWDSSDQGKLISAKVAAMLGLGLCADCTQLETDGKELFFYRPAFAGNIIAKIKCTRSPAMATLRTKVDTQSEIIVGLGMGVRGNLDRAKRFAELLGAETAASRAMVDGGNAPYEWQVGVTGKIVSPQVYIAVGISGAVHHISGIRSAGKIIAINPDKNAPIFNFADYGIVASFEDVWSELNKNGLNGCVTEGSES